MKQNKSIVIGVTGGVGAGKSTILKYLKEKYEAYVIIADQVGHDMMLRGCKGYQEVVQEFSDEILNEDNEIDRGKLGAVVFADKCKMEVLNQILHPVIKEKVQELITNGKKEHEVVVVEAALLLEDHYDEFCDTVWYVFASEGERRKRLKASRGYSDEKISQIFKSQAKEEYYRKYSDIVIDNEQTTDKVYAQIDMVIKSREVF